MSDSSGNSLLGGILGSGSGGLLGGGSSPLDQASSAYNTGVTIAWIGAGLVVALGAVYVYQLAQGPGGLPAAGSRAGAAGFRVARRAAGAYNLPPRLAALLGP